MKTTVLSDVKFLEFINIVESNSVLAYNENLRIIRIFTVSVANPEIRGGHAHKKCGQWVSVIDGSIQIELKDGDSEVIFDLKNDGKFLFIPPGIWSVQNYAQNSKLLVLCDDFFEEDDYIRSWSGFLHYKSKI